MCYALPRFTGLRKMPKSASGRVYNTETRLALTLAAPLIDVSVEKIPKSESNCVFISESMSHKLRETSS